MQNHITLNVKQETRLRSCVKKLLSLLRYKAFGARETKKQQMVESPILRPQLGHNFVISRLCADADCQRCGWWDSHIGLLRETEKLSGPATDTVVSTFFNRLPDGSGRKAAWVFTNPKQAGVAKVHQLKAKLRVVAYVAKGHVLCD